MVLVYRMEYRGQRMRKKINTEKKISIIKMKYSF